jgi:hypothetical protein
MEDKDNSNSNPFDDLGVNLDPEDIKKQIDEHNKLHNRLDYLIHATFSQTLSGTELLTLWEESLKITPGANPGMDSIEIGIIEGKKAFIRNIILTIRRVDND